MAPSAKTIVGIGEALVDHIGDDMRLGGAPLNVAVHAQQLGNHGVIVSRIGYDDEGKFIREQLRQYGVDVRYLQTDPDRPSGVVYVHRDEGGEPEYEIVRDVAWDVIQFDGELDDLSRHADAVCYGTLAQRNAQTRTNIYRFLEFARPAVRLFDVNLRGDEYDRRLLERSLTYATAVKVNTAELRVLDGLFALGASFDDAARSLMKKFTLKWLALTRGPEGAVIFAGDQRYESPAEESLGDTRGESGDVVGAGDATSAALLHGVTHRWPWPKTLTLANRLGAYVASQPGACPELTDELRQLAAG